MPYRKGDVILVPFDVTDRSGVKLRPAVVVSGDDDNQQTPDIVIASITGNLTALPHPGDRRLTDWNAAGLLRPSLAQSKLATIERTPFAEDIGGDLFCFDYRRDPAYPSVVFWSVDTGSVPLADSFTAFLDTLYQDE